MDPPNFDVSPSEAESELLVCRTTSERLEDGQIIGSKLHFYASANTLGLEVLYGGSKNDDD